MKTIKFEITIEVSDNASALLPDALNDEFIGVVEKFGLVCEIERGKVVPETESDNEVCNDKTPEQ